VFGIVSDPGHFALSSSGLLVAELMVAIATSLLLGLFVRLTWRWAGPIAAIVGGLIMATEPFFVAHGSVIHVDELTALFGITGTVALLLALDVPRTGAAPSRRMSVLAGLLLASAFLTKVSAVSFVPGLLLVTVVVAFSRPVEHPTLPPWLAGAVATARRLWPAVPAGVVLIVVAWPALWADPANQIHLLVNSARQATEDHSTFFLGHPTPTPGWGYYFVAEPFRMTPWFLLGALGLGGYALWRTRRARLLALLALPQAFIVTVASKQFDRYALPILAILALIVGIGADAAWRRLRPRLGVAARARARPVAFAAALLMFVNTVVIAPWGLAYFNPLLGGSATAQHALLVGWGEGLEKAGAIIQAREGPDCNVSIAVYYLQLFKAFPCGEAVPRDTRATYLIVYVNDRQRVTPAGLATLRARGRLIATIRIRGIDYAELYDTRPVATASG
jgi:4-amino-4-deoxy-L-arabinose transferase-like glycosyltransferase